MKVKDPHMTSCFDLEHLLMNFTRQVRDPKSSGRVQGRKMGEIYFKRYWKTLQNLCASMALDQEIVTAKNIVLPDQMSSLSLFDP